MTANTPVYRRLIAGLGGAASIVGSFLPWASIQGFNHTGWELNGAVGVLLLFAGAFGIATAVTGGQLGVMRPDVSLIGATDILDVTATVVLAWLVFVDFPEHATRQPGVFLVLASAAATAFAVADYRPLRGAPWFPPIKVSEPTRVSILE
jgi:hypothetical protein